MRNSFIAALAATTLFATFASAETYDCRIKSHGPNLGLISDTITVRFNDASSNAMVSNAVILATNGNPVVATVTANSAKRQSLKWVLNGVVGYRKKLYETVAYRLVIWKTLGNKVSIVANYRPREGADMIITKELSGSGKCERRDN